MRTRQLSGETDRPRPGQARRRPRRLPVATAVAAVMALAGCADVDGAGSPATPAATGDGTDDAVGADLPLLQIERRGGFVLMGTDFASVPELTVYPDGEAITHGPQIAIYPPPALPNLVRHTLADADVEALVAAARDAGLLGDVPDYGQPPVADAPTTSVTLRVDGREYVHSAEALGLGDGVDAQGRAPDDIVGAEGADAEGAGPEAAGPEAPGTEAWGPEEAGTDAPPEDGPPGDGLLPGLTDDERAARAELAAFVTRAHELVGSAGDGESIDLDAFAVMARPAPDPAPGADASQGPDGAAGTMPAPDDGLEPQVVPWPLDVPLADAGDCVLVDGDDARALRDALGGASLTTLFEQGGTRYDVWVRPLLPHEDGCDDV